jgi:flagellar capping protein FliD
MINDTSFSFDGSASISKIMSAVNASAANVKMSYSSVSDTFTIVSKETGSGSGISLTDVEGTFLNKIMGGGGITSSGTDAVVTLSLDGSTDENSFITITRSTNSFSLEGTTYTLTGMSSGSERKESRSTCLSIWINW